MIPSQMRSLPPQTSRRSSNPYDQSGTWYLIALRFPVTPDLRWIALITDIQFGLAITGEVIVAHDST